jgi:hypothetical protein
MGRGTLGNQDPYQTYLMNQVGLQNVDYASVMAQLGLDQQFATGMYDVNNQSSLAHLGLANRGTAADQARANALWQLAQQDAGARGGFADARWTELQRNNAKNVNFSGQELGLNMRDIGLTYDKNYRQSATDATARGARTSRGYSDTIEEHQDTRDLSGEQAKLSHNQTIESLLNQYNNGKITWEEAKHGIDQSLGGARVGYEHSTAQSDIQRDANQQGYTDAQLRNALEYWQAGSQIGTESQRAANQHQQGILNTVQTGYQRI